MFVPGSPAQVVDIAAGDASIVVAGTGQHPTIVAGTLDQIANLHPAAAAWSNNSKKITSLANGAAAQDAAAFGQIPTSLPTTQSLDQIAVAHVTAADWSNNSHKITSVADPTLAQDAATKNYVDASFAKILGAKATGWSHTGDVLETLLASVTIPANAIGLGQLEILSLWSVPSNGNTKTMRVRFGAANDLTGTQYFASGQTTIVSLQTSQRIANRGTSSQICFDKFTVSGIGTSATAPTTSAIDTTNQSFVVFSGQCGNAGDTITLESYLVRLIPGV